MFRLRAMEQRQQSGVLQLIHQPGELAGIDLIGKSAGLVWIFHRQCAAQLRVIQDHGGTGAGLSSQVQTIEGACRMAQPRIA